MGTDGGWDDSAWAPRPAGSPPATLLPGYRDVVQLARGGDSVVYRAHQDALDRDVAIKVVELDDPESIARFRRELAITVQLGRQHPNIMTVLATGTTTSGQPCLVMDYMELGSLHDRLLARGPLPVSEVVAAGTVIADALAFAHGQGVLHRDVKPQNVLVLPTSWVLADFGLARAIDAGHSSSLERFSYRHASPQILDGEAPTIADDVYSLGSTLFTLLDGRAPFAAENPDEDSALAYLRRARTSQPRRPARDDVPPPLLDVVLRCLARDRTARYADAAALRDALAGVPTESRTWSPRPVEAPVEDRAFAPPAPSKPVEVEPVRPVEETPQPANEPAEPVAVEEPARSALARLPRPVDPEAGATGLRPAEPHDDELPGDAPPPRNGGRGRWLAVGAAAVVALGTGIGVGVWRSGDGGTPAAGPGTSPRRSSTSVTRTPSTIPTTRVPTDATSGTAVRAADPRVTTLRRNSATSVELGWSDPGRGRYGFIVFAVVGGRLRPLDPPVAAGQTSVTEADVAPGRHCFAVGMVVPAGGRNAPLQIGPVLCRTT